LGSDHLNGLIGLIGSENLNKACGMLFKYTSNNTKSKSIYAFQRTARSPRIKKEQNFYILYLVCASGKPQFKMLSTENSIKLGNKFDFIIFDNKLFVYKTNTLVSQFGYKEVLKERVERVASLIDNFLSDSSAIKEMVNDTKCKL